MKRKTVRQQKPTTQHAHATWVKAFLTQLSVNGNVSAACDAARINRATAYDRRDKHADFKKAWDDAITTAIDDLEAEAHRRASVGTRKPVWFKGELVGYDLEYSDTLMALLLRGHRPEKYGDKLILEIKQAMPVLNELAEFLRAQNVDFTEAQRQFLEMLKAQKDAANVEQSGDFA